MNDKGMDVEEDEDARVAIRLLKSDFPKCDAITSAVIPRPGYAGDTGKAPGDGGERGRTTLSAGKRPRGRRPKTSTTEAYGGSKRRKQVIVSLGRLQLAFGKEGK
jgi:hypothetical protein